MSPTELEPLERPYAALNAVEKFARRHRLGVDRVAQGRSGVMVFVENEQQWRDWMKHLRDIHPEQDHDPDFHTAHGTIKAVPVTMLLWKGDKRD